MTEKRNPTVPFGTFYHPPVQLPDIMEEHGCLSSRNFAVMNALFSLVDFNHTERIGKYDMFTGWTVVVSHKGIGKRCGLSERRTQDAIKDLLEKGMIAQEKIGKCYRYRLKCYDESLDYLRQRSEHPMTTLNSPAGSEKHLKRIQDEASDIETNSDGASDIEKDLGQNCNGSRTKLQPMSDGASDIQEVLQEPFKRTPGPGSNLRTPGEKNKGKNGGLGKKHEDFVPNHHIGEAIDALVESKRINAAPTEDNIEAFVSILNPLAPAVTPWKEAQAASALKGLIEGKLSAAGIEMPPLLFFKRCVQEMEHRIDDGKIAARPSNLNFFINAYTGKDIIEYCLDRLGRDNQANLMKAKTDARIQELKEQGKEPREMPAHIRAELDKILGGNMKPPFIALDLFCGGGGAAIGLWQAGFDTIVGIDIKPHPNYPFDFVQADVLHLPVDILDFDFIWASPPCQLFSLASGLSESAKKDRHPNLIPYTRCLLSIHPWTCIENVPTAPIRPDVVLTGPSVGLPFLLRRRHFETSFFMMYPPFATRLDKWKWESGRALCVTKSMRASHHWYPRKALGLPGRPSLEEVKMVMGIPQRHEMTYSELGESIPPAYSKFIGEHVLKNLRRQ